MAFMQRLAIQTSDPRAVCWAGGNLEGEVVLVLTDSTLIRGIRLSYRCEAHVDFMDDGLEVEVEESDDEDNAGMSGNPAHKKRKKKKGFMKGVTGTPRRRTATEKFLETTSILWGTEPTASFGEMMPAGHHSLAFDVQVPKQLPASFEGRYGFVRHWLECVVDRPGASEMSTKRALSVISHADLNKDPVATKKIHHREEVILCCGCLRPDRYDVSYELPYRGYVPGETMFPDFRFRNFTRNPINIFVRLQMITTYKAKTRRKITTKVVAEEKKTVHRAEVTKWEPSLQVPALPPTGLGGCHIIDARFFFEVELTSTGFGWQGLSFQDEIKVGTIPVQNVAKVRQAPLTTAKPASPKMAVLLGPAYSASAANGRVPGGPNRASSRDGKFTSDADSASPLARMGQGRGAKNQRSSSIISTSSHWSFHPMAMAARPAHHPFHWKFPGWGKQKQKPKKAPPPKPLPTVYRC
ncbi:arrestin domain-containing protein 2-like isoform X2 [Littorina saxatilis]|uniref:arrestin domain-containing protein 2-like isoform X2 n=1 Tax=Littorina saxatilis TaxID=31220 RepID=UPI0038B562A5